MIRRCDDRDFELIWTIINDGAQAYKGTIPQIAGQNRNMSRENYRMKSMRVLCSGATRRLGHW